jgi:hypothetical protein
MMIILLSLWLRTIRASVVVIALCGEAAIVDEELEHVMHDSPLCPLWV